MRGRSSRYKSPLGRPYHFPAGFTSRRIVRHQPPQKTMDIVHRPTLAPQLDSTVVESTVSPKALPTAYFPVPNRTDVRGPGPGPLLPLHQCPVLWGIAINAK